MGSEKGVGENSQAQKVLSEFLRAGTLLAAKASQLEQLRVLVDQAYDISGASLCCVYLYSNRHNQLQMSLRRGGHDVPQKMDPQDELFEFINDCRESLVLHRRPKEFFATALLNPQMQSAAVLPLLTGDTALGYLFLNHKSPDYFCGERFLFLDSYVKLASGSLESAALYTELEQQFRQIHAMERYQQHIFDSMTNLLVTTNADGTIQYINQVAREKLAIGDDAIGRQFDEVLKGLFTRKLLNAVRKADSKGQQIMGLKGIMQRPEEQGEMDFSLTVSPLRGQRGRKEGLTLLFTDQTAEKQLQNQMDTVVEERRAIKDMFARYLSNDIVQALMKSPDLVRPGGDKKNATIFFADIRGYTSFSESKEPEVIIDILNGYFSEAVSVIIKHRGFIDKFIGDCIMAAWGIPLYSEEQDAISAVSCAMELQDLVRSPSRNFFTGEAKHLKIGIGMHTGPLIAGNLGSSQRMDYSVIGDTVNIAARLEGVAGPDDVIITQNTRDIIGDRFKVKELEPVKVKGKSQPLHIFKVLKELR
ncbi:MAG: guanylate cyclase [Spirochaetaceae bacterium]|nr:MAG: guanylate cyclase [Spirochaetaceae bacterium]